MVRLSSIMRNITALHGIARNSLGLGGGCPSYRLEAAEMLGWIPRHASAHTRPHLPRLRSPPAARTCRSAHRAGGAQRADRTRGRRQVLTPEDGGPRDTA